MHTYKHMTEKCTRNYRGGLTPESWYCHTVLCSVWIFLNVVNSLPFQFKKALNNWKKKTICNSKCTYTYITGEKALDKFIPLYFLYNIPSYEYILIASFYYWWKFELFPVFGYHKSLRTFLKMAFIVHLHAFCLDIHLEVECMGHKEYIRSNSNCYYFYFYLYTPKYLKFNSLLLYSLKHQICYFSYMFLFVKDCYFPQIFTASF